LERCVAGQVVPEGLDRDVTTEPCIATTVHLGHAAEA
jgi:hypothetical protein